MVRTSGLWTVSDQGIRFQFLSLLKSLVLLQIFRLVSQNISYQGLRDGLSALKVQTNKLINLSLIDKRPKLLNDAFFAE